MVTARLLTIDGPVVRRKLQLSARVQATGFSWFPVPVALRTGIEFIYARSGFAFALFSTGRDLDVISAPMSNSSVDGVDQSLTKSRPSLKALLGWFCYQMHLEWIMIKTVTSQKGHSKNRHTSELPRRACLSQSYVFLLAFNALRDWFAGLRTAKLSSPNSLMISQHWSK